MLDNVTMMGESGGDPNAVSPAGARGLMQVMPTTAHDPGFGIRPSNGTPADDVRVGQQYRAVMQRRYGGDLPKMWAAYNWGPGNLDHAITAHGNDWMSVAPPQTRAYIAGNMRRLGGG
jgi:soluble lytic murein transglycosylase